MAALLIFFPGQNRDPVRIEFFGDRIESIRSFNVISQRSIEEIGEIELLPATDGEKNRDTLFDYLNPDTIFIIEEQELIAEKARLYQERIETKLSKSAR